MKLGLTRSLLLGILLSCLSVAVGLAEAEDKRAIRIAVVDIAKLLKYFPETYERRQLADNFAARQRELARDKQEIEKLQEILRDEEASLDQETLLQHERELRTKQRNFKRKKEDFTELQRHEKNRILLSMQNEIESAVKVVGDREQIDLVLRGGDYMFASERINITQQVLEHLRKQFERDEEQQNELEQETSLLFGD